tara:strand:+ start:3800 stop:4453 length:654 start_codon:yes stop_codon:yes gene_type:complete
MEVKYYTEPFKLDKIPLDAIHVIDNWCPQDMWQTFAEKVDNTGRWNFNNNVTWDDVGTTEVTWMMPLYGKWMKPYDTYSLMAKPIIERMCSDFGVEFKQFDYAGLNGQTRGLQGTIHKDNYRRKNLSFLWHINPEWEERWKGAFRVYKKDALDKGQRGFSDRLVQEWQIAEIKYKPNRLIIMDGSYPHSADAPGIESGFTLRKTMVVFGNVVELVDN